MPSHTFTEPGYAIVHDGATVYLYTAADVGESIATGQPHLETFATEEEARACAAELGYVPPEPEPEP